MKGFAKAGVTAVVATAILSCAATAQAQAPHPDLGAGVPIGQTGVQLYNWSQYINNNATSPSEIVCPAPPADPTPNCVGPPAPTNAAGRLQRTFEFLASKNVRNVELYGYTGNPFPTGTAGNTGNIAGLQALRAQGDALGLRFVSNHGSPLNENNWDNHINMAKILGQEVIGAADPPNAGSTNVTQNLNNAALLNRLGKRSVEAGVGPAYFHNHANSFSAMVNDNGVMKRQWQFLMDHTDPRYVKAQIDIGWATNGSSQAFIADLMANPVYAQRVISFHVKDVQSGNSLRELGNGNINFTQIFANSKNWVRWYLYEYDPTTIGGNTSPSNPAGFQPFNSAEISFNNMRGPAEGVAYAPPQAFDSVPAGTPASSNAKAITVRNISDGPLAISGATPAITAAADDGGAATAADFAVVSNGCANQTLATGETCTVNVGFKPTRISTFSSAVLHIPSNGDDATDAIPLYGTSTSGLISVATGDVGANVGATLSLSLPSQGATFSAFIPGVAANYDSSIAANVISSAGDATLTVADGSSTATGHLVNGTFSLPSALQANASSPAGTGGALANVGGSANPTTLLTYTGPVSNDTVTIGFRQAIGATDALRTGTYSKTLTFTLSTTTP